MHSLFVGCRLVVHTIHRITPSLMRDSNHLSFHALVIPSGLQQLPPGLTPNALSLAPATHPECCCLLCVPPPQILSCHPLPAPHPAATTTIHCRPSTKPLKAARVEYKALVLVYRAAEGAAPPTLPAMVQPGTPVICILPLRFPFPAASLLSLNSSLTRLPPGSPLVERLSLSGRDSRVTSYIPS